MDGLTLKEILVAVGASAGFIVALVSAFKEIGARLDARRSRLESKANLEIHESLEAKRLGLEVDKKAEDALWRIIDEQKLEIAGLEEDLKNSTLSRKAINQIYANLRAIRKEIESLNIMILNEEETNVFMRRFQTVKGLLDETESIMP